MVCVRNLLGGRNKDWHGTPLQSLYDNHVINGAKNPYNMAARDVGNLLKKVLWDDEYRYYKSRKKRTKEYKEIKK